jgi:hypothetical protein
MKNYNAMKQVVKDSLWDENEVETSEGPSEGACCLKERTPAWGPSDLALSSLTQSGMTLSTSLNLTSVQHGFQS